MDRKYIENWLNILRESWLNKDSVKAASLFTNTTFYQETPFMDPYTTLDEIREEWQHIKNENIQNIEIKVLAIDKLTVIAQWILKQNDNNYDGIYYVSMKIAQLYKFLKSPSALMFLLEAKKDARAGLSWLPPLVLYTAEGEPTPALREIYREVTV